MSDFLARTDAGPPHWAGEQIEAWDDRKLRLHGSFIRRHYWTDCGSLNVFCVRGSEHPDYQGLTWHEFLHRGKRMDRNIALLESNPDYYQGTERKFPSMYYNSYNGLDWFIGADGNHRTGLARFLFHERQMAYLHGLCLNHYEFDDVFLEAYLALCEELRFHAAQGFYMELEVTRVPESRRDTAGWKTDLFSTALSFSAGTGTREVLPANIPLAVTLRDPVAAQELLGALQAWRDARQRASRGGLLNRLLRRSSR
ncbi:hypothetical protein NPF39_002946 [Salmonella enterica subsp. enterica serovar Uganda]|nr:hypothetical protein [Salmonella enterica]EAC1542137.1 hypothetical protein [Salmonella enterica subsp. enterica]EBO2751092.1 hypothetical protein [Salmonella enterica subsp. enterica serovar Agona]EDE1788985.1 hypothetical protein [Salmonella enterica subsp. enterica serovar Enteritidis]EEJ6011140.1 hypothetical protein [Salmonella enterica subsp. enterica serovar Meleagridis]EGC3413830.1 hypothetical protein [Salmonella enterica subsp. enterica serovar Uganda]EIE4434508.1 hypothetical pr